MKQFLALVSTVGLAAAAPAAADAPVRGGDAVMVLQSEPPILTSAFNSAGFVGVASSKMLEGLLSYDFDLGPQPLLAKEWQVAPDGMTVTFRLREGVKWHDGQDFTAKDVAYSLTEVWSKLHPRGKATFANVASVATPDPHTVVLTMKAPYPPMMQAFSSYEAQVLPAHLYEGTDVVTNPANNAPVGTGPFRLAEWQKGNFIRLERFDGYWDAGKPYLDSLTMRYVPDASARAAALETGEAHIGTFSAVPLNDLERLRGLPHLELEMRGYEYLSPIMYLETNNRGPYLGNAKVRQALAHAIDRQFIIDVVWYGLGQPSTGPIPSTHKKWYTTAGVPQYPYDPDKANALLDEAGFPRGTDGVRFPLTIDFSAFQETYPRTAEYLKQAYRKVGVDLQLRSQDIASLLKRVFTDYDYDIHMNFWYAMPDPTIGVQRLYWSDNIRKGVPFANSTGYRNPRVDELLVATQSETDEAKRAALFKEFQQIAQTDLPVTQLFEMTFFTIANTKLKNHTTGADGPYGNYAGTWLAR